MQFGWTVDEPLSIKILNAAFEAGINFIDTANVYSRWVEGNPGGVAEAIIGKWIKQASVPRDQLVIATKVRGKMSNAPNDEGLSRKNILHAVEGSLKRLGVDYVDLYQAHSFDGNVPIEETLGTFDDLVHQGKVRYIGCSNYPAWRLTEALWTSRYFNQARYDSLQPRYNLVHRVEFESELMAVCRAYGLGVIPYSPLASGFLTEKYRHNQPDPDTVRIEGVKQKYYTDKGWAIHAAAEKVARENAKSISQVALAWLLNNPVITSPIIGSRSLEQLDDNLGAVGFKLSDDAKKILDEVSAWQDT
jgi:aryl-alcohol dehydrogenase-like predicted oxidoreductase